MNKKIIFLSFIVVMAVSSLSFCDDKGGRFSGKVLDKNTDKPLTGASISVEPGGFNGLTGDKGEFSFDGLELSTYAVRVFMFGYDMASFDIDLNEEKNIYKSVLLVSSDDVYLNEVVVRSRKRKIEGTKQVIRSEKLKNTSTSLFNDTMASLQKLPGVSGNEFSGLLYIRGGTPFENIALMDDIAILFPYHWGGRVSMFNPDMVEKVDFYTGGFPAVYGMATSGVIDVNIKKGNFEHIRGFLDLSVTGATLELESPLASRTSFIMGARRTHYDLIMNLVSDRENVVYPYFDDVHLKFYSELSPSHTLSYNVFYASEGMEWELSEEDAADSDDFQAGDSYEYHNSELINSLQWIWSVCDKVKMKNTFAYDHSAGYFHSDMAEPYNEDDDINIVQFRNDWDVSLDKSNSLSLGYFGVYISGDILAEGFSKETKITGEVETTSRDFDFHGDFDYHGAYIQDEYEPVKDDLILSAGVRYEKLGLSRHSVVSPRAGLKKKMIGSTFLNLGWGIFYRYDINIRIYDEENGNRDIKPEQAVHYLAGLESRMGKGYVLKNDCFYKEYKDIVTEDPVRNYINGAEGYSYGFETIIEKKPSTRLDGWLSYTYAFTWRKVTDRSEPFDPYNDPNREIGKWYFPDFDQRHTVALAVNYKLSDKWSIYSGWDFHTGRPYTDITGAYKIVNDEGSVKYLPVKDVYNGDRLPQYHKLDLKIIDKHSLLGLEAESYLEFINLYGRKNVYTYYYDKTYTEKKTASYFPFMVVAGMKIYF